MSDPIHADPYSRLIYWQERTRKAEATNTRLREVLKLVEPTGEGGFFAITVDDETAIRNAIDWAYGRTALAQGAGQEEGAVGPRGDRWNAYEGRMEVPDAEQENAKHRTELGDDGMVHCRTCGRAWWPHDPGRKLPDYVCAAQDAEQESA